MTVFSDRRQLSRRHAVIAAAGLMTAIAPAMTAKAQDSAADATQQTALARGAAKDLGENLKAQLMTAMKSGGAIAAISVCNTVAPSIASDISTQRGMKVGRTALKVRNPANAPDAFEMRVLEEFASKIAAGMDASKLEHAETVTENGVATFRYMKAIPMAAEPCAACHGTDVKPDVKAAIDKLYPKDEATGFKPGELRGAFSIRQAVK